MSESHHRRESDRFARASNTRMAGLARSRMRCTGLIVERGAESTRARIVAVRWRGMRCRITVETNAPDVRADLRLNWKQPTTSIVASLKESDGGECSLAVPDDKHEGAAATVLIIDNAGNVLDYKPTTVGEDV